MTDYIITECPSHGTIATACATTAHHMVRAALACQHAVSLNPVEHHIEHIGEGSDCLSCCPAMVVDPDPIHVSTLNGSEIERSGDEYVCLSCLSVVPFEGHEEWECREEARDRNAERDADYMRDAMRGW